MTAAVSTDGIGDPLVEVGWELGVFCVDEVEDELTVAFRTGQARVYDAARLCPAREQRFRHLAHDAPLDACVAHDTLADLRAAGLELGLDQDERLPGRRGEPQCWWQRELDGDE